MSNHTFFSLTKCTSQTNTVFRCRNAPPSILNVRVGQPVELRVARRVNEAYQPPLKRANPFAGTGNRLGSVVPNVSSSSTSNTLPGSFPSGPPPSSSFDDSRVNSITTRFEVDQSRPTTSVQIRLADGTRFACSFSVILRILINIFPF